MELWCQPVVHQNPVTLGSGAGFTAQTFQTFILKSCLVWRSDAVSSCASPFGVYMSDCSSELVLTPPATFPCCCWGHQHEDTPMEPRARVKFRKCYTGTILHLPCSPHSAFANCLSSVLLVFYSLQFMMQFSITCCTWLSCLFSRLSSGRGRFQ